MKLAYAGSFDPFTNGHLHIVQKALDLGNKVTILIADNPNKKNMFSALERESLLNKIFDYNIDVCIVQNDYIVNYAKSIGCDGLLRGIRTERDFQDEVDLYHVNKNICKDMETVYLMPDIDLSSVRSSVVKALIGPSCWTWEVKKLIPEEIMIPFCKKVVFSEFEKAFNHLKIKTSNYDIYSYHNWEHIAYCLAEYGKFGNDEDSTRVGILFHDCFDFNEKGKHEMKVNLPKEYIDIILATNHDNHPVLKSYEMKLVHDIDLSVLAWTEEKYDEYVKLIEEEYLYEKEIEKEAFIVGRKKFLKKMLKSKIFELDVYSEEQAKENMSRELVNL